MAELKLNNDHEFRFSVKLLRQIIATEQKRLEKMISNYTPEMVKKPVSERMDELEEWFEYTLADEGFDSVDVTEGRVVISLKSDYSYCEDFLLKRLKKIFPDCTVVCDDTDMSFDKEEYEKTWHYVYSIKESDTTETVPVESKDSEDSDSLSDNW